MKQKAVFLDRDNTLIEDPGYINHPGQVKILPGAATGLVQLRKMGYLLVVVSNQSGVARGLFTEETLTQIHHTLEKQLADEGAYLDAIYYCPFHPEGSVAKYRMESELRKPAPGMLLKAAADLNIDLAQSWMIGDSYRDIEAGRRAGCRTILINNPVKPAQKNAADPEPDRQAVNIREAVNIIRMIGTQKQDVQSDIKAGAPTPAPARQAYSAVETAAGSIPSASPDRSGTHAQPASQNVCIETDDPEEPAYRSSANNGAASETDQLLHELLVHLKAAYRLGRDEDFSIWMLLAGVCQVLAVGCLILSLVFYYDSTHTDDRVPMLLFTITLQLMALTFFLVRSRG